MIWVFDFLLVMAQLSSAEVKPTPVPVVATVKPMKPEDALKKFFADPTEPLFDCEKYLASLPAPRALFASDENALYYLANNLIGKDVFSELLRIDLKRLDAHKTLNMPSKPQSVLIGSGQRLQGAVVVSFDGRLPDCYFGPAELTQLSFSTRSKNKVTSQSGYFGVIQTQELPMMYDLLKKTIFDLDPILFQTRSIFPIYEKERPIYFNVREKILWTVASDKDFAKTRSYHVKKRIRNNQVGQIVLKFKEPMRLFFDKENFGFILANSELHTLKIFRCKEILQSQDAEKCPARELKTPKDLRLEDIRTSYSAKDGKMILFGNSIHAAKRWAKAFVIDLDSEKAQQDEIRAPAGRYVAHAEWIENGPKIIFEMRDYKSESPQNFLVFDSAKKTTDTVLLQKLRNSKGGN